MSALALIAGRGRLPDEVSGALAARGQEVLVAALEGNSPERLQPDLVFRIETLGSFLNALQAKGVREICMAGSIGRPDLDPSRLDAATLPLVPKLMEAIGKGDDGALRIVIRLFEDAGLQVRAAHEICPELLVPEGVLTTAQPAERHGVDAQAGVAALAGLGLADKGQACVIRQGKVLALEDARGTDAMLADLKGKGQGGILYKGPKPGQDMRADLPAVGPETAKGAAEAGLEGIVLQAGAVFTLERAEMLRRLDAAGMFLWGRA